MELNNEKNQNIQALNETAKSQQLKKTWVEPELIRMDGVVEGGGIIGGSENFTYANYGSQSRSSGS